MHFGADADFGDAVVEHDVPGDFISVIEEATPDAATLGSVSAGSVRFCWNPPHPVVSSPREISYGSVRPKLTAVRPCASTQNPPTVPARNRPVCRDLVRISRFLQVRSKIAQGLLVKT